MIEPIEATQPVTIPAVAERVCDKWAITRCLFEGAAFPLLSGSVEVTRYGVDSGGVVMSPELPTVVTFHDLFTLAETDPDVASWLALTVKIVKAKLDAEGVR